LRAEASSGLIYILILRDINERKKAEAEHKRLQGLNLYLEEEVCAAHESEEVIGRSPALRTVMASVRQVAGTDATVLITGETGTGKGLIARALHNLSNRKERPLIKLNCATIPGDLAESELFDHEKEPSLGPSLASSAASSSPIKVRCFSMKSGSYRWTSRPSSYGCCRKGSSSTWAGPRP
jgi:hypothetical protein